MLRETWGGVQEAEKNEEAIKKMQLMMHAAGKICTWHEWFGIQH